MGSIPYTAKNKQENLQKYSKTKQKETHIHKKAREKAQKTSIYCIKVL